MARPLEGTFIAGIAYSLASTVNFGADHTQICIYGAHRCGLHEVLVEIKHYSLESRRQVTFLSGEKFIASQTETFTLLENTATWMCRGCQPRSFRRNNLTQNFVFPQITKTNMMLILQDKCRSLTERDTHHNKIYEKPSCFMFIYPPYNLSNSNIDLISEAISWMATKEAKAIPLAIPVQIIIPKNM